MFKLFKTTLILLLFLTLSIHLSAQFPSTPVLSHETIPEIPSSLASEIAGIPFGAEIQRIGDLNSDGFPDIAVTSDNPGALYILFLDDNGQVLSYNSIDATDIPAIGSTDLFGEGMAYLGDIDGDGKPELAVGAPDDDYIGNTVSNHGTVYILTLESDGSLDSYTQVQPGQTNLPGPVPAGSKFGWSVGNIGDINGDGITDIAVGQPEHAQGTLWVILLNSNKTALESYAITSNTLGFNHQLGNDDWFGIDVDGLGDFDGNGTLDIAVTAPGCPFACIPGYPRTPNSRVFLLMLDYSATTGLTVSTYYEIDETDLNNSGLTNGDHFGAGLANIGDVNSDGVVDLAVGAVLEDQAVGVVYIVNLAANGTVYSWQDIEDGGKGGLNLPLNGYFGFDVANLGDIDGDGKLDIAASSPNSQGFFSGTIYVMFTRLDYCFAEIDPVNHPGCGAPTGLDEEITIGNVHAVGKVWWNDVPGATKYTIFWKPRNADCWFDAPVNNFNGAVADTAYFGYLLKWSCYDYYVQAHCPSGVTLSAKGGWCPSFGPKKTDEERTQLSDPFAAVKIFPNPGKDKMTLQIGELTAKSYAIMDVHGRIIRTRHRSFTGETQLDLMDLTPGIFQVVVHTNAGKLTKRIVVLK